MSIQLAKSPPLNLREPRSGKKQTLLNMVTTIISNFLSLGVSFFLTPYIVSKLGAAAYGFLGLSNNIIGYTALFTVALNSMASRFVSLHYHKNNYYEANRYLTSTFFANCGLAFFIVIVLGAMTVFLEDIINIPPQLVSDIKFLFTLLFVNSAISLCTGILGFSTFVKNRIDLSNITGVFTNILRVTLIIIAYGFFPAHVWYIGAVGLFCTIAYVFIGRYFYRTLTPEFSVRRSYFNFSLVREMTREGAWNLLSQMSSILNQGLELLLANIFIGAYFMGVLSITKNLPFILLGIIAALGGNFHPECIRFYAEKDIKGLNNWLVKGIRIMGVLSFIPCAGILAYGDIFYASWLPGQDYKLMYHLTAVTMVWLTTTMSTQALWYIFTITKTVRRSSIVLIQYGVANCILVLIAVNVLSDDIAKLFAIVTIQAILGIFRFCTFLPFYGAKVLGLPKYTFFKPLMMTCFATFVLVAISLLFKYFFIVIYSWRSLIVGALFTTTVGIILGCRFMLSKPERDFILVRIFKVRKHEES